MMQEKSSQKPKQRIEEKPDYMPPRIVTYSREELLAEIGPAQACSPYGTKNGPQPNHRPNHR